MDSRGEMREKKARKTKSPRHPGGVGAFFAFSFKGDGEAVAFLTQPHGSRLKRQQLP